MHVKYVDGYRGVAALIVVLHHFILAFYPALYNGEVNQIHTKNGVELIIASSPINLVYNGNLAVCIFFLLSGYVLSYKYFRTNEVDVLVESAVKRYYRLLIPVLVSIILAYLLMKFSLFYNKEAGQLSLSTWWLASFWNFDTSIFDLVKNAFFDVFFYTDGKYNAVLWTMTYEFFGSLLVFGFSALFGRVKNRQIFYIVALALTYRTNYLGFILGLILCDLKVNGYFELSFFRNYFSKFVFLMIGLYLGSYPTGANVENSIYKYIAASDPVMIVMYHVAGAFFIMLFLINSQKLQTFLSTKLLLFLGKISFSMYVIHLILIGSFTSFIFIIFHERLSYSISVLLSFILTLPILLILSYLMYKYIDRKAINLANILYSKYFKNT